jgi:aspartate aminotransferase
MRSLSHCGEFIIGSQIISINNLIKTENPNAFNYTIGDFNPEIHPIPPILKHLIFVEYQEKHTNYPASQGELSLRQSVSNHLKRTYDIDYTPNEILIGAGVRPLIYTMFKTIIDPMDVVVYPVPSWNNDHYTFLHEGRKRPIFTLPENNFNITLADVEKNIKDMTLLCLCSPQNPTGTMLIKDLDKMMNLIVKENSLRADEGKQRPIFVFFDQIYMNLMDMKPEYHPLLVCPEIRDYLICVDGVSKSLCATGVRVGWMMAPNYITDRATQIFSHIGAWAPKPEQIAVGKYLNSSNEFDAFIKRKKADYVKAMEPFMGALDNNKSYGFDYIKPEGGIYLSIKIPYKKTGKDLKSFLMFLVKECNLGIVPFDYFGATGSEWFRLSIGCVDPYDKKADAENFDQAILKIIKLQNMLGDSKL